jgi:hypothetical protein
VGVVGSSPIAPTNYFASPASLSESGLFSFRGRPFAPKAFGA